MFLFVRYTRPPPLPPIIIRVHRAHCTFVRVYIYFVHRTKEANFPHRGVPAFKRKILVDVIFLCFLCTGKCIYSLIIHTHTHIDLDILPTIGDIFFVKLVFVFANFRLRICVRLKKTWLLSASNPKCYCSVRRSEPYAWSRTAIQPP
eukprot:GEMP01106814.1.p1 GENE.GEMP01106814.1~~GEMP01106814.1.p1  ORF type:complete len:147 (+),score=1.58 GEMP01106814.1:114-554(+)